MQGNKERTRSLWHVLRVPHIFKFNHSDYTKKTLQITKFLVVRLYVYLQQNITGRREELKFSFSFVLERR